jgi:glucan phosphorylase
VKHENKRRLARLIHDRLGLGVNAESLIDVQIKRMRR